MMTHSEFGGASYWGRARLQIACFGGSRALKPFNRVKVQASGRDGPAQELAMVGEIPCW